MSLSLRNCKLQLYMFDQMLPYDTRYCNLLVHRPGKYYVGVRKTDLLNVLNPWKRISCKQSARWQHLYQLKPGAFFSLQKIVVNAI